MKTKSIFTLMLGMVFLVLAFAPLVSASLVLDLMDDNWNDIENGQFNYNQGDTFIIITEASSFGENINTASLELIGPTTYSIFNDPVNNQIFGLTSNINTVSYIPGTYTLEFKVIGSANTATKTATIIITGGPSNNAPVITSTPVTSVDENTAYTYQVTATDADADTLTYSATGLPSGLSINSATGLISGTAPNILFTMNYNIIVTVSDGTDVDTQSFTLTVNDVSSISATPTIIINSPTAQTYTSNVPTQIDFTPTDADGDLQDCRSSTDGGVTWSSWTTCSDGASNLFTGLVPVQGSNTWMVEAQDVAGNVGSASVTFTVNDLTGPVITAVNPLDDEVLTDTDVTFIVTTNEGATLNYSLDGAANVTMTETSSLQFESALLSLNDNEEYTIIFTATDAMGNTASLTINFTIDEVSSGSSLGTPFFGTEDLEGSISIGDQIDLTDDDPNEGLTWWQRFLNWLARLFGLEEIY